MSSTSESSDDGGPGRREVAHRIFAAEFDDADFSYSESDEERAPNYVITPSGARVNRLFLVGVLTETEWVNDDMLRARVVDPTGPFVTYAGQYQPEALGFLERTEPPAFLAVTGKARTFEPEDGDRVFTSVRPESISEVDADTRDRWAVEAAKRTIDRVGLMAAAMETDLSGEALVAALEANGVEHARASGIALALDHYGTTPAYLDALRDLAVDTLRMVAGDLDEAGSLDVAPDEGGGSASALADRELSVETASLESASETDDASATTAEETAVAGDASETAATGEVGTDTAEPVSEESTAEGTVEPVSQPSDDAAAASAEPTEPDSDSDPGPDEDPAVEESTVEDSTVDESSADGADHSGDTDDIGDFEPTDDGDLEEEDLDDFDPDEDDALTDEERSEVEEEFGTDFSTGNEVGTEPELEPDEEPGDGEPAADVDAEPDPDPPTGEDPADAGGTDSDTGADADVSVDEAVMDAMTDLDDGDGADREELVAAVVDRTGADPGEVEDAVDDALMSGRCYEPEDGLLKPI